MENLGDHCEFQETEYDSIGQRVLIILVTQRNHYIIAACLTISIPG